MANDGKSRRAQGAGDGKSAPKKPAPRAPQRRSGGLTLDSEQSARLLIFGAVAVVLVIAAAILIFGYWYSVIRPRHRTVLSVDGVTISYDAMKRRMAHEFLSNTAYQSQNGLNNLAEAAYQTLLNELTEITQAESKLGITLTQEEFDSKFRDEIGAAPAADQRTFADQLRKDLDETGLKESELRRLVRAQAIEAKITEKFKAEAPATTLQAKLEVISAQTQEVVQQAIDRINAGEDFATVAKSVSTETDVQTTGGVHDYGTQGSFTAAYNDYAFTGEIGKLSAPLASAGATPTYYVVRVIDRSDQPTKESEKPAIAKKSLDDWLKATQDELQAAGKIKRDWEQQAQNDALVFIQEDTFPKFIAQKQKQQEDQQKAEEVRQTTVAELTSSPQVSTPAAGTPAPDTTPAAETPSGGAPTSAATAAGTGSTPAAPSQPVAPGTNGP